MFKRTCVVQVPRMRGMNDGHLWEAVIEAGLIDDVNQIGKTEIDSLWYVTAIAEEGRKKLRDTTLHRRQTLENVLLPR